MVVDIAKRVVTPRATRAGTLVKLTTNLENLFVFVD